MQQAVLSAASQEKRVRTLIDGPQATLGSADISGMSSSVQVKVDQLIVLCEKAKPLSASDVAAIRQLLAAGAGVVNCKGKSR